MKSLAIIAALASVAYADVYARPHPAAKPVVYAIDDNIRNEQKLATRSCGPTMFEDLTIKYLGTAHWPIAEVLIARDTIGVRLKDGRELAVTRALDTRGFIDVGDDVSFYVAIDGNVFTFGMLQRDANGVCAIKLVGVARKAAP